MEQNHQIMDELGVSWIFCVLHNFGGRMGPDGELDKLSRDLEETAKLYPMMIGTGITAEALGNSPIVNDLLINRTLYSDKVRSVSEWTKQWLSNRYGMVTVEIEKAWTILLNTVYQDKHGYHEGAAESLFCSRPTFNFSSASSWGHSIIRYRPLDLIKAADYLIQAYPQLQNNKPYQYDLAEILLQVLSNAARSVMIRLNNAYLTQNLIDFIKQKDQFLKMIEIADKTAALCPAFSLHRWIDQARSCGTTDWEKDCYETNARNLITLWGNVKNKTLRDYSNRRWSGLFRDFYGIRWKLWLDNREQELKNQALLSAAENNWPLWESGWISSRMKTAKLPELTEKEFRDLLDFCRKEEENPAESKVRSLSLGLPVSVRAKHQIEVINNLTCETKQKVVYNCSEIELSLNLGSILSLQAFILYLNQGAGVNPYDLILETSEECVNWIEIERRINTNLNVRTVIDCYGRARYLKLQLKTRNLDLPLILQGIDVLGCD